MPPKSGSDRSALGRPLLSREGVTWNRMVTDMIEAGFTHGEAVAWAAEWHLSQFPEILVLDACDYRNAGFTVPQALAWFLASVGPTAAVLYASHGWNPQQARTLWHAVGDRGNSPSGSGDTPTGWRLRPFQVERDWLATGLPAHRATRYAAAGVVPSEARYLEARHRAGDPTVDVGLRLLAALRTGGT